MVVEQTDVVGPLRRGFDVHAWRYVAQNRELPVIYVSSHNANAKCCKYIFISLSSCTTQVEIQGENEQYPTNSEIDTNPVS